MYTNYISKGELVLCHHGIKGQKWGIRRYQNEDGTLTPEGEERYKKLKKIARSHPEMQKGNLNVFPTLYDKATKELNEKHPELGDRVNYLSNKVNKILNDELFRDKNVYKKYFMRAYNIKNLNTLPRERREACLDEINNIGYGQDQTVNDLFMNSSHPALKTEHDKAISKYREIQDKYIDKELYEYYEKYYGKKLKDI